MGQEGISTHETGKPRHTRARPLPNRTDRLQGPRKQGQHLRAVPRTEPQGRQDNTSRLASEPRATVGGAWEGRRQRAHKHPTSLRGILSGDGRHLACICTAFSS